MPPEKKNWTWQQHLNAKKPSGQQPKGPGKNAGGPKKPGGEKKSKVGSDTPSPGGEKKLLSAEPEAGSTTEQESLCADGVAKVGPVAGYYTCDGGCDRATEAVRACASVRHGTFARSAYMIM